MSLQPTSQRGAKSSGPRVTTRRKKSIDHAEIVRMAVAQSASHAAERRDMVATAAYFRAQKRGFEPGHEMEDWLAAEADVAHAEQVRIFATGVDVP